MKLSQFQFNLPKDKIAQEPPRWRDECKLMVLHKDSGEIEHRLFKDIIDYFGKGDTFVLNDTKVFPAQLSGNKEKTGAEIDVFLLRELNREQRLWDVIVDPARKIRIGNKLYFGEDESLVAEVIDNTTSRGRTLRFLFDGSYEDFKETLFGLGKTPVPTWVKDEVTEEDKENFQTIFAKEEGAVSAPAAGLHFSRELFNRMILKDINKTYQGAQPLHVLKGINLDIEEGEFVSIMGASGSGKSTLLNILGILDNYDSGEYVLGDTLIKDLSESRAAEYRNKMIGFIFQSFNLIGFKTAVENVELPLFYQGVSRRKRHQLALDYLDKLGLLPWADHYPNEMSGGQKQRVAIARALITQPRIILADEPTGALDSKTSVEVMQLLKQLNAEEHKTIVVVTHESGVANETNKIVHIKDGIIGKIENNFDHHASPFGIDGVMK